MIRNVTLNDISDGRLYTSQDMVKADCNGCDGCSACCRGMGSSIVLDPLDIFRISGGLGKTFEQLLSGFVELNVVDGIILPNLAMNGAGESCAFLNSEGRCSIHALRPGFCRMFPLGRFYDNGKFRYFLQTHECHNTNRTKIKIREWLDVEQLDRYEEFINDWHYYCRQLQQKLASANDDALAKNINVYVLNKFFIQPYGCDESFYEDFYERLGEARKLLL